MTVLIGVAVGFGVVGFFAVVVLCLLYMLNSADDDYPVPVPRRARPSGLVTGVRPVDAGLPFYDWQADPDQQATA